MTPSEIREPRLAAWFVDLCAPPREADAILGDLREEFVPLAHRDGVAVAKRWYARHAARAVVALLVGAFRSHLGLMLLVGIAGMLATAPVYWTTNQLAMALVRRWPVYHYVSSGTFWSAMNSLPFVIIGAGVSRSTRRQPMAAACAVVLTIAVWTAVDAPILAWWFGVLPPTYHSTPHPIARWAGALPAFGFPTLIGGAIGRKWRASSLVPKSPSPRAV